MAENLSISLAISGRVDGSLTSSLRSTKASISQLAQSLKELKEADRQAKNLQKLENTLTQTSAKLKASTARYAELAQQMRQVDNPSKTLQRNFAAAATENERLRRSFASQSAEIKTLRTNLKGVGVDVNNLSNSQVILARNIDRATKAQNALLQTQARGRANRDSLNQAYAGLFRAGAVGFGLQRAVQPAIDFESAIADVAKVVTFTSEGGLATLQQRLVELSRVIPLTRIELAQIAEEGGKLNISPEGLLDFVPTVAKIATAFDILPEEAANAIGKLQNVFALPDEGIKNLAGSINILGNSAATNERAILDVLNRVAGISRQFQLTETQTAALGSTFLSLGLPAERSATAINSFLQTLQTAEVSSKKVKDGFASIGVNLNELAADIQANPQQAIFSFIETLSALDNEARATALVQIFGKENSDELAIFVNGLDEYRRQIGLVTDATQAWNRVEEEFTARIQTTESQTRILSNRLGELAGVFTGALLPILKTVGTAIGEVLTPVAQLVQEFPKAAGAAATAVVGFTALRFAFLGVRIVFGEAFGVILKLTELFQRFSAARVVSSITAVGAASTAATASVTALAARLATLAAPVAIGAGAIAGTTALAGAMNEAAAALKSNREATENYRKDLETTGEATSEFAEIQRRNAEGLTGDELTDYSEALSQHEEYWRSRLLLEQDVTGAVSASTRERWESALEELRIVTDANKSRESLQQRVVQLAGQSSEAEQQLTASLQAQIEQRKIAYDSEKAKLAEVAQLRAQFQTQVATATATINQPEDTLATGTPVEALRVLDQSRSLLAGGEFEAAQAAASRTIELVTALSEAGLISNLFANQLLGQAAETGEGALTNLELQRQEQTTQAEQAIIAAEAQLAAFEATLQERQFNIKLGVEEESLQQLRALLQSYLTENPITLPVVSGETATAPNPDTPGLARGGFLRGPGTGTSDSILMRGSAGEFMTRAKAVKYYGVDFFKKLNSMQLPKFATGGLVGRVEVPELAGATGKSSFTVNFGADSFDLIEQNGQEEGFIEALRRQITKRGRRR